jgi:nuclear protein localization family protein 4
VHSADVKCNNCLPPSQVRYNVDLTCKQHEPYPKAMCNKCVPPNVVIKRQEYRHVDYVQFMNVDQIQEFIQYWLPRRHEQQRVAYLYGYYAEDPHYKGGIRVIVETLY